MRRFKEEQYDEYHETLGSLKEYEPSTFKCAYCGEWYNEVDGDPQKFKGETICRFCAKEELKRCGECGKLYDRLEEDCPYCLDELKKQEMAVGEKW